MKVLNAENTRSIFGVDGTCNYAAVSFVYLVMKSEYNIDRSVIADPYNAILFVCLLPIIFTTSIDSYLSLYLIPETNFFLFGITNLKTVMVAAARQQKI